MISKACKNVYFSPVNYYDTRDGNDVTNLNIRPLDPSLWIYLKLSGLSEITKTNFAKSIQMQGYRYYNFEYVAFTYRNFRFVKLVNTTFGRNVILFEDKSL